MRGKSRHIGVDLLGSDTPPKELLKGILAASEEFSPHLRLTLFGTAELFEGVSLPTGTLSHVVDEIIGMEESPLVAIRQKKSSSLCLGIRQLSEGLLDAFISAGNTGALMAYASVELKKLSDVKRPGLLTLLPTRKDPIAVVDVGANTSCKAEHLVQFALMGVAYQKSRGIELPKVALLNIGSEPKKGTPELQDAYVQLELLAGNSFIFSGNMEGRDVFQGQIDVLVTDGFTGNVFLKTAEGIASFILEQLEEESADLKGALGQIRKKLHYAEYPGALLSGVEGILLKCHGSADSKSFIQTIKVAYRLSEHAFLDRLKELLFYGKRS
ncbi:MAG: phosphate acyltransferase PlsX [Verrucomicrobia bacterium]|nr:phosphate acyltransferase PlsX [Verrucomicrobiota bacterium]